MVDSLEILKISYSLFHWDLANILVEGKPPGHFMVFEQIQGRNI